MSESARTDDVGDMRDSAFPESDLRARLAETWGTAKGWVGALSTVDHKIVGRRYIVTAFAFMALGGLLALAIRLQLSRPDNTLLSPDKYNQVFSMHGATMMFLFAVPVMEAIA